MDGVVRGHNVLVCQQFKPLIMETNSKGRSFQPTKGIKYVKHEQINAILWNKAVLQSKIPLLYAMYEYLDAVCDKRWDALIFNDYEAVFPLPKKVKWGIPYLIQPIFCQQLGAFGSNTNITTAAFLGKIPKYYLRVHLQMNAYFDQHPTEAERIENSSSLMPILALPNKTNLTLDLNYAPSYNKDCKKNLNYLASIPIKYATNNVTFKKAIDLYRETWGSLNPKLGNDEYQRFETACLAVPQEAGLCFTISATKETNNTLLATAIFLMTQASTETGKICIHYVCAAPTKEGKSIGIMHGIIDHVIQQHLGKDVIFDFEGSSIPSVAAFYQKFGAVASDFHVLRRGI